MNDKNQAEHVELGSVEIKQKDVSEDVQMIQLNKNIRIHKGNADGFIILYICVTEQMTDPLFIIVKRHNLIHIYSIVVLLSFYSTSKDIISLGQIT